MNSKLSKMAAAAAAVILAATLASTASANRRADANSHRETYLGLLAARLFPPPISVRQVLASRAAVWRCQHEAVLPATRAEHGSPRLASAGRDYRAWIIDRWEKRLSACERIRARTIPNVGDWMTAVRLVQRFFPGSEGWLDSCSSSEGGHGGFVWLGNLPYPRYGADDTPGGWMQYKWRTFWTDLRSALAHPALRGIRVPPSAISYSSPLGQAIAAGWAYFYSRPSGKWTGSGC